MKRIAFLIVLVSINLSLFSQVQKKEKTDKKDTEIQPVTGDWAIGIDATPFFQYIGNLFSQNGNPYTPGFAFTAQYPGSVYLKYKLRSRTTLRMILIIGGSHSVEKFHNDNETDPNTLTESALSIGGIAGLEKKVGMTKRVSGFFGGQAGFIKQPYDNGTATGNINYVDKVNENQNFIEKGGNTASFIVAGFTGIEWFFLPRVAITGEVGVEFSAYKTYERIRQTGDTPEQVVSAGGYGLNLLPTASGNLSVFIFF